MSKTEGNELLRRKKTPSRGATVAMMVVIAVAAFTLGGLLFSGDGSGEAEVASGPHQSGDNAAAKPALWTCSMHPQIQLPKPGKCPICFMDLIPVEMGTHDELGPTQLRMSEAAMQLAGIETSPVIRSSAQRDVGLLGKLDYDESKLAYITARVPGRLDRLYADYTGIGVTRGDKLVEIYSPELISAQEELLQAEKVVGALRSDASSVLKSTAIETARSAREKLRLYGLSESQIDAAIRSGKASEHLTITAPKGGVVVHKDATEGMYVSIGTRIYTIADLSTLWVRLEAYESDLRWLREGQHLSFTATSFPGEEFDAVIDFIDPLVDPQTRTVDLRATVHNKSSRLKPEMFVNAVVHSQAGYADGAASVDTSAFLLIPATAPLLTGKRAVVYVKVPSSDKPTFEGREITLGARAGDYYIVVDGLAEGEQVVTNGAFRIDSELQIQAKRSMMSPRETAPLADAADGLKTIERVSPQHMRREIDDEAQAALTPVYASYFDVQMALAADNLDNAKKAYGGLVDALTEVGTAAFQGEAHDHWMELSKSLLTSAGNGLKSDNLETARDAFFYLSRFVIELHDAFGHAEHETYFLTFCPMARNNKGAYWLQRVDTVYNSFYGESMLRCGEIKKPLPAGVGDSQDQSQHSDDPLTQVYHAYFRLQRALTFEELITIEAAYRDFAATIEEWSATDPKTSVLAERAREGAVVADLATARSSFRPIAEGMVALHDKHGHSESKDYYLIRCPHAAEGGASWIQDVDTMYNPFLGGVMETCTEEKIPLPPLPGEDE